MIVLLRKLHDTFYSPVLKLFLLLVLALLINACNNESNGVAEITDGAIVSVESTEGDAEEQPTTEPTTEPTTAPAEEEPDNSSSAPELLVVRLGVNANFEPFVFRDESGQVVGFDMDLINAMAQSGNFEPTFIDLPFEELLSGVESGELDAAISAITVTEARAERVQFSDVYFRSGQAPVSFFNPGQGMAIRLDETTIVGADNLAANVKIGVKANTTGEEYVETATDAQVVAFGEAAEALHALSQGTVDAVVVDIPVIVRFIENNPDAGLRITGGPLTDELYAIAVNPTRSDILERLNDALAQLKANGTYDQIFQKWFGSP